MTTLAKRGSGTPTTSGTTWAALTNAVDGTAETNPATYATYTNATASAVGYVEISGYDFASTIASTDTLNSVSVSLRHFENNTGRFASVTFQAYDGATAIGTATTCTLATAARNDTATVAATLAQLRSSTFKIRVTVTGAASTQSRVLSIDHVDVTADYTIVPPSITQAAYRLYADGTESGATALAGQDTGYTADTSSGDVNLQVRVRLQSTTGIPIGATDDFQLQWEKNTSGTWTDVLTAFAYTNLVPNPSIEVNSTGWTNSVNGTVARDGTKGGATADSGSWAVAATSTAAGNFYILSASPYVPVSPSTEYRVSVWVWSAAGRTITSSLSYYTSGLTPIGSSTNVNAGGLASWRRIDHTVTTPSNAAAIRLSLTTGASAGGEVFWADAAMITQGSTLHDYFDGTTAGASWNGTAHNSSSTLLVPATGILPYASANLTEGAATTNRLGAGSGSFVAGKVSEDGLADNLGWTANNYTELLFSVTLKQADLVPTDTLRFRVLRNGATTGMTYSQYPSVTIGAGAPAAVTGTATGQVTIAGAASGSRNTNGTATGTLSVVGNASGTVAAGGTAVTGTATGTLTVTGTATGTRGTPGTATGSLAIVGVAVGVHGVTATATGTLAIVGTATGRRGTNATATGTVTLTGTASGQKTVTATATGQITIAATALGQVVGNAVGTATGTITVVGTATGLGTSAAIVGQWNGETVDALQWGDTAVVEWMMT